MAESSIEWTDATWNPVAGCNVVSPGCTNCYAMRMAARLESMGVEKYRGLTRRSGERIVWTGTINLDLAALETPHSWKKPRRVFVNSMSDLFHEEVPEKFVQEVWQVMEKTRRHTYQILTKRPDRMKDILSTGSFPVLPNVWLGVSVESVEFLSRIDSLRQTPASIRFVSFEPLLESVSGVDLTDIDWAIVGGESGPKARSIEPRWVDEIMDACEDYGTAFFFKQWGGVNKKRTGRKLHGRTWDNYPSTPSPEYAPLPA